MKFNEDVMLVGVNVALVPYKRKHVEKYNSWMQNPELQNLTASEPLSLEEEFEMQELWQKDETKLTFIVLDVNKLRKKLRHCYESNNHPNEIEPDQEHKNVMSQKIQHLEQQCMVGDVNLFFNEVDKGNAEISVMIAEKDCRRKGYGFQTACLMMNYAKRELNVDTFTAKIGTDNKASKALFEKLNFEEVGRSIVFQEVTMQVTAKSITSIDFNHTSYGFMTEYFKSDNST
ncbi:N-acetyltransferase 9-like protein [Clavelina lepadiformis]|uniref:N-acetyltransferase domain-containing protein n=1 Tax=Clavelina lepadiformis TaxID=159417 RepID=A0ABP0EXX0_CLALP